jgi:hypothetical protein
MVIFQPHETHPSLRGYRKILQYTALFFVFWLSETHCITVVYINDQRVLLNLEEKHGYVVTTV